MKNLLNDLRRAILCKYFLFAAAAVFLMYLQDGLETLMGGNTDLVSLYLQISTIGSLHWLVPCAGAIAFAGCYVRDRQSQCYRYFQMRLGVFRYCTSKTVACFASAWLATFLGIASFIVVAYLTLGYPDQTSLAMQNHARMAQSLSLFSLLGNGQYILFLTLRISLTALCAGFWAILGMVASSFWMNIYIAMFSPIIIMYFKDYIYKWIHLEPWLRLKDIEWCEYYMPGVARGYGLSLGIIAILCLALYGLFTLNVRRNVANA